MRIGRYLRTPQQRYVRNDVWRRFARVFDDLIGHNNNMAYNRVLGTIYYIKCDIVSARELACSICLMRVLYGVSPVCLEIFIYRHRSAISLPSSRETARGRVGSGGYISQYSRGQNMCCKGGHVVHCSFVPKRYLNILSRYDIVIPMLLLLLYNVYGNFKQTVYSYKIRLNKFAK